MNTHTKKIQLNLQNHVILCARLVCLSSNGNKQFLYSLSEVSKPNSRDPESNSRESNGKIPISLKGL